MSNTPDDRIKCPRCGRRIVPKITFHCDEPYASWCPMCGCQVRAFGSGIDAVIGALILVGLIVYFVAA